MTPLMLWNGTETNSTNQTEPDSRNYRWNKNEEWVSFLHPQCVYLLFYIMILEAKELFNPEVSFVLNNLWVGC